MMLYVMRHGPAEDRALSGRDEERALTREGRALVRRMGEALRDLRASHTDNALRFLSSARVRARQTAMIVAEIVSPSGTTIELCDELGGERDIPLHFVEELAAGDSDVLLVGHNPCLQDLVSDIARGHAGYMGFSTATIVALSPGAGPGSSLGWRITTVLDPRILGR